MRRITNDTSQNFIYALEEIPFLMVYRIRYISAKLSDSYVEGTWFKFRKCTESLWNFL